MLAIIPKAEGVKRENLNDRQAMIKKQIQDNILEAFALKKKKKITQTKRVNKMFK